MSPASALILPARWISSSRPIWRLSGRNPGGRGAVAILQGYRLADLTVPDTAEPVDRSPIRSEQEEGHRLG
jgi:hypothetical protein